MALIHESLYSMNNLEKINVKIYFEQLFSYHLDDFPDVNVDLALPSVSLSIDKMMPLSMIINELISNSIKHAFEKEPNPKINFLIREHKNELSVLYSDNGSGYGKDVKNSFGMDLINTLIEDLETTLSKQNQAKGIQVGFTIN
jgi:two-component sensor histidine kinase